VAPRQPEGGTNGLTHIALFTIESIGTRAAFEARFNFIEPVQRFTQTVERLCRFLGRKRRLEVSACLGPVPTRQCSHACGYRISRHFHIHKFHYRVSQGRIASQSTSVH
jgi:hypothetical protein